MATIRCPSCGKDIDANSFTCEHCSYSLTSTPSMAPGPKNDRPAVGGHVYDIGDVPSKPPAKTDIASAKGSYPPPAQQIASYAPPPPVKPPRPDGRRTAEGGYAAVPAGRRMELDELIIERPGGTVEPTVGAIGEAWDLFKSAPVELIFMWLIVNLCGSPMSIYNNFVAPEIQDPDTALAGMIAVSGLQFVLSLVQTALIGGTIIYALKMVRGQPAEFGDLFKGFRFFVPLVITGFLTSLAIGAGMLLLIIPGIILSLGFYFVLYVVVDKNIGYIDAMKASWQITRGHKADIFIFSILCSLVGLLGAAACCVGVIVAAPVVSLATAVVYNRMAEPGEAYYDEY